MIHEIDCIANLNRCSAQSKIKIMLSLQVASFVVLFLIMVVVIADPSTSQVRLEFFPDGNPQDLSWIISKEGATSEAVEFSTTAENTTVTLDCNSGKDFYTLDVIDSGVGGLGSFSVYLDEHLIYTGFGKTDYFDSFNFRVDCSACSGGYQLVTVELSGQDTSNVLVSLFDLGNEISAPSQVYVGQNISLCYHPDTTGLLVLHNSGGTSSVDYSISDCSDVPTTGTLDGDFAFSRVLKVSCNVL